MANVDCIRSLELEMMDEARQESVLLSGKALRLALGFDSAEAFRRAVRTGRIPVRLFKIAGRQGWFAKTHEVATWFRSLDELRDQAGH
jgi:hypothetical protein